MGLLKKIKKKAKKAGDLGLKAATKPVEQAVGSTQRVASDVRKGGFNALKPGDLVRSVLNQHKPGPAEPSQEEIDAQERARQEEEARKAAEAEAARKAEEERLAGIKRAEEQQAALTGTQAEDQVQRRAQPTGAGAEYQAEIDRKNRLRQRPAVRRTPLG